jgi:hypothetical protein
VKQSGGVLHYLTSFLRCSLWGSWVRCEMVAAQTEKPLFEAVAGEEEPLMNGVV